MNKLLKVFVMAVMLVLGGQTMAQTRGTMFLGASFPMKDYADFDGFNDFALTTYDSDDAGAGIGFNAGIKWYFNVGVEGRGPGPDPDIIPHRDRRRRIRQSAVVIVMACGKKTALRRDRDVIADTDLDVLVMMGGDKPAPSVDPRFSADRHSGGITHICMVVDVSLAPVVFQDQVKHRSAQNRGKDIHEKPQKRCDPRIDPKQLARHHVTS